MGLQHSHELPESPDSSEGSTSMDWSLPVGWGSVWLSRREGGEHSRRFPCLHAHCLPLFIISSQISSHWSSHHQALCMTQKKEKKSQNILWNPGFLNLLGPVITTTSPCCKKRMNFGKEMDLFPKRNSTSQEPGVGNVGGAGAEGNSGKGSGVKWRSIDLQIS